MQEITREVLVSRAGELMTEGKVDRILGWSAGEYGYDVTPAVFQSMDEMEKRFVWNSFCGVNFSKYLIGETKKEGRVLVFLKPCDSYSFNQLLTEHRFETLYDGSLKVERKDLLPDRCLHCKSGRHVAYDELLGEDGEVADGSRFDEVERIEAMSPDERFAFWQGELSRCIRCNACRDVCPACTCEKCVFDNPASGVENKAAANSFEEQMFHIIRAFHVAGRCTDCGECSRVCPQHIPLHLLNRKFIKDINSFYGEYQAGAEVGSRAPVVNYTTQDLEPGEAVERGSSHA